jgi:GT2 family glycosyltransferase
MGPAVTVVVCSRDRHEQLAGALPAIVAELGPSDQLVVVDSASRGRETAEVAAAHGLQCVRVDEPGLSRARNAGVRAADAPVVAFTDDDCRPLLGWLDAVREPFADPAVGFVTGQVSADTAGPGNSLLAAEQPERYAGPRDVAGIGHGANMAFRRAALAAVGPFDERLGAGAALRSGEDADMLYRCLEGGWHGVYAPGAVVSHDQWRGFGEMLRLRYGYGLGNGAYRAKVFRRTPRRGIELVLRPFKGGVEYAWLGIRTGDGIVVLRALLGIAGTAVGTIRGLLAPCDGRNFKAAA